MRQVRDMDGEFGRWLDVTMQNNKIKGTDLARRLEVTDSAVSRWRKGAVIPAPDATARLAKILGVDPVRLLVTAGHLEGDTVGASPYTTPEARARREKAKNAIESIKWLTEAGRQKLLETYDDLAETEEKRGQ